MARVAQRQPDLFAPEPPEAAAAPAPSASAPLETLQAMLAELRGSERLPWRDAAATMAEERRALGLARAAGAEGERLVTAILAETERLLSLGEG